MRTRLTWIPDALTRFQFEHPWSPGYATTWATATVRPDLGRTEFLVCPRLPSTPMPVHGIPVLLRTLGPDADLPRVLDSDEVLVRTRAPFLLFDADPESTPAAWWIDADSRPRRIDTIAWVGADVNRPAGLPSRRSDPPTDHRNGRRSRTIGALGGDPQSLARLQHMRFALLGCGRNGALLASHLAAIGVQEPITLIDDDLVEIHNADAMGLDPYQWIGERKVDAVAHLVRRQFSQAKVETVFESASHPRALRAMVDADMILCSVDHGRARTLAATVASSCLRPLVDVGTGVRREAAGLTYGCDVRLVLPGSCLLCWGGVDDPLAPRDTLWFQQRAGSLRSLNAMGTGLAQLVIEQFARGAEMDSLWMQIRYGPQGISTRQLRATAPVSDSVESPACPVCARMAHGPSTLGLDAGAIPTHL